MGGVWKLKFTFILVVVDGTRIKKDGFVDSYEDL